MKMEEVNIVYMKEANIVKMNTVKMKQARIINDCLKIQNLPLGFENCRYSSVSSSVEMEEQKFNHFEYKLKNKLRGGGAGGDITAEEYELPDSTGIGGPVA